MCLVVVVIKTNNQSEVINYSIDFFKVVTITAAIVDDYWMLEVSRAVD